MCSKGKTKDGQAAEMAPDEPQTLSSPSPRDKGHLERPGGGRQYRAQKWRKQAV